MQHTVVRQARRIDPTSGLDEHCDLLVAGGIVERVGDVGSSAAWPESESARIIEPTPDTELIVCPGLVDLHTHVYGAAGVRDVDSVGVRAGVPIIADAGGASAATIDDFVAHRLQDAATRVKVFLSIELGGIVESHLGHNTNEPTARKQTASLDDFLAAIERHMARIAGLKLWATSTAGLPWVDHAANLSEMVDLPLLVHVGDVDTSTGQKPISGETLDRLQGGDIVTHCFTGLPGALIDESGRILNEVCVARARGVRFDAAPGKVNLSFERATRAMEQGWLPDTISTDIHRWCIDHPVRSLANIMSTFMALGLTLEQVIERTSTRPAALLNEPIGTPEVGQPATLSVLALRRTPAIFGDGSGGTVAGSVVLEPVGCFLDGEWFEASTERNTTDRSVAGAGQLSGTDRAYLAELESELRRLARERQSWRGSELHQAVHRARTQCGLPIAGGIDALFTHVLEAEPVMAAGWVLEELGATTTMDRLSEALAH